MNTESILRQVSLFSEFSEEALTELAHTGITLEVDAGVSVVLEGEDSHAMYVILKGETEVYKRNEAGDRVDLNKLEAGEFFGEMSLFDSRPRSATVATLTPCQLFMLDRTAFVNLLLNDETRPMAFGVVSALVQRVRSLMERFFEQQLVQRTLQAEMEAERHRALAQMVAGIAHELNTPLGVANTAIDMIETRVNRKELTELVGDDRQGRFILEDMQEASGLALRNIGRAHKLVQNFKKISVNQLTDEIESVDIIALVYDIVDLFKFNARQSGMQIEVHDKLPPFQKLWTGYPGYLTQILTNFLFNAEKYAYPGSRGGRIDIELEAVAESYPAEMRLTFKDYGEGIAPEHLSQLFTPFFTTGRGIGGTGLGLAIVNNLVTGPLQGSIVVESALGEGTSFTLQFPQVVTSEPPS